MARFGIRSPVVFGISVPVLRSMARGLGRDHPLAQGLWATRVFEARLLAAMIDDPRAVTPAQREAWAEDFDNWAICDTCCGELFRKTAGVDRVIRRWSRRPEEFVKRAAFALIADLAVHDRDLPDARFRTYLEIVERSSDDERIYVRKAVNWALRQVGKRNPTLWTAAIRSARRIGQRESRAARWIASDALRELTSPSVRRRVGLKRNGRGSAGGSPRH